MLEGFDKSDIAMMQRDIKLKLEYEEGIIKLAAKNEGIEQGKQEGRQEGAKQNLESNIRTMYEEGLDKETIAKVLRLDIN